LSEAPESGNETPSKDTALHVPVQASSSILYCPLHHNEFSYWNSPEDIKLFNAYETENNAKEAVQNQIEILAKANDTDISYLDMIDGKEETEENTLTGFKNIIKE
jgi:hypothetical protein